MAKDYYANKFDIQLSRFMAEEINDAYDVDMYMGFTLFSALKYVVRAGKKVGGEPTSEADETARETAYAYDHSKFEDYVDMIHVHSGWTKDFIINQLNEWAEQFKVWPGNAPTNS